MRLVMFVRMMEYHWLWWVEYSFIRYTVPQNSFVLIQESMS